MIPISRPYMPKEIDGIVIDALHNDFAIGGEYTKKAELLLADIASRDHAVLVNSGHNAIRFVIEYLKPKRVDVPAMTFISTATAPLEAKCGINIRDVDTNFLMEQQSSKIEFGLPVSLYGRKFKTDYNYPFIEDACQAIGNSNPKAIANCFSFYTTKNIHCFGNGGGIATDDKNMIEWIKSTISHGRGNHRYEHIRVGTTGEINNINAAILWFQLKHVKKINNKRISIAKRYNKKLKKSRFVLPKLKDCVFHQYVIMVLDRDSVIKKLDENDIQSGIHYPIPIHKQECINVNARLPNSESYCNRILSLPMYYELTQKDQDKVIGVLNEC